MLTRPAFALISVLALSVSPAQSQPSGGDSAGVFAPAPMTGSTHDRFVPPERTVATPSSTPTSPQEAEQEAAPLQKPTAAPTAGTPSPSPGPLWTRREPAPAATRTISKQPPASPGPLWTRRETPAPTATRTAPKQNARRLGTVRPTLYQPPGRTAVKEGSIQKRPATQLSQVRPNRRLGAKPTGGRQEARSRAKASGTATWAETDQPMRATRQARRTEPARTELAPRATPQLPHGLMPRHARRE
jgi:hypothetical protein